MARKLSGFQRVLDAPALFSVAYGEIASSLYFALGIVAAYALGFTPLVLLFGGVLFLLVSLSYAEGTAAIPETGGAATFVRRAFNDVFGFLTGWALFLDYLIVIALSTLFLPHYLGTALGMDAVCASRRGTLSTAVLCDRGDRGRPAGPPLQLHAGGIVVAGLDLADAAPARDPRLRPALLARRCSRRALSLGTAPAWHDIAFALPLAMLAYTGLETVANLPRRRESPGGPCRAASSPRSGSWSCYGADRDRRRCRPSRRERRHDRARRRSGCGLRSSGSSTRFRQHCPAGSATRCASTSG